MQVNSINRLDDTRFTSINARERSSLESLAYADDRQLRALANRKAAVDVDDKKHNRITKALFMSIPVAAGVASAVAVRGKFIPKYARSKALMVGALNTLSWLGTFLAIDTVFAAKRGIAKHSDTFRKFDNEHPFVSFATTVAASVGLIAGASLGLAKLGGKVNSKPLSYAERKLLVLANNKINNSKVLNAISKNLEKVPSSIRAFAKGAISWGPSLLVVGSVLHSIDHSRVKMEQTNNNYINLKMAQSEARNVLNQADEQFPEADDID